MNKGIPPGPGSQPVKSAEIINITAKVSKKISCA